MAIKYAVFEWQFDMQAFAELLKHVPAHEMGTVAQLLEIDPSTFSNWANNRYKGKFVYPNMTNFLKVINFMEVNPGDFFVLVDILNTPVMEAANE